MAISREAVIWGFKLFLGRLPESESGIAAHMALADELALAKTLANSKEFERKNRFSLHPAANSTSASALTERWQDSKSTKIALVGNCQARGIANLIEAMSMSVATKSYETLPAFLSGLKDGTLDIQPFIQADIVLAHPRNDWIQILETRIPHFTSKVKYIPPISFSAYQPDCVYVENKKQHFASPIGAYHSSLAFYGWKNGLSIEQTLQLFSVDVYESIGFFQYWNSSLESLTKAWDFCGLPISDNVKRWSKQGCWMHTINHPKLFVLADVARAALSREKITALPLVEAYLKDELAIHACWPVYPEIGNRLGIFDLPQPYFKKNNGFCPPERPVGMLNLEEFVHQSFAAYGKFEKNELECDRVLSDKYLNLHKHLHETKATQKPATVKIAKQTSTSSAPSKSPYGNLPDHQFWRRAIEKLPMGDVDPVVRSSFTLNRSDKVATAGSCFAQHISRTLQKKGFNYYIPEQGDSTFSSEEAQHKNYGVFSARFGNLYSARQLVQLFDRAYNLFAPIDSYWVQDNGRFVDPFRPQVEPEGFSTKIDLDADRVKHFAAVREMFENLDVMVFTLGLTEAWRNRIDGAVFPIAPGVTAGSMDLDRYEFVNFNVADVTLDMQTFIDKLLSVNPRAKMLLTVSPVPLIATYEKRHVLVSTTYSKSVLRAAAEEISNKNVMCDYFPSYEIITGNYNKGAYFEADLRSVKPEGVEHVMGLFLKYYSSDRQPEIKAKSDAIAAIDEDLMRENSKMNDLICDEDALDPQR
jgi:GSCFA family/Polysaccharide biosynthesis enzyme WcbI